MNASTDAEPLRERINFGATRMEIAEFNASLMHTSTGPAVLSMDRYSLMHSGAQGLQTLGNTLFQEHVEGREPMKDVSSVMFGHSTPSTEGTKEREKEQDKPIWHECNRRGGVNGDVKVTSLEGLFSRIMQQEEVQGITHGAKTDTIILGMTADDHSNHVHIGVQCQLGPESS